MTAATAAEIVRAVCVSLSDAAATCVDATDLVLLVGACDAALLHAVRPSVFAPADGRPLHQHQHPHPHPHVAAIAVSGVHQHGRKQLCLALRSAASTSDQQESAADVNWSRAPTHDAQVAAIGSLAVLATAADLLAARGLAVRVVSCVSPLGPSVIGAATALHGVMRAALGLSSSSSSVLSECEVLPGVHCGVVWPDGAGSADGASGWTNDGQKGTLELDGVAAVIAAACDCLLPLPPIGLRLEYVAGDGRSSTTNRLTVRIVDGATIAVASHDEAGSEPEGAGPGDAAAVATSKPSFLHRAPLAPLLEGPLADAVVADAAREDLTLAMRAAINAAAAVVIARGNRALAPPASSQGHDGSHGDGTATAVAEFAVAAAAAVERLFEEWLYGLELWRDQYGRMDGLRRVAGDVKADAEAAIRVVARQLTARLTASELLCGLNALIEQVQTIAQVDASLR